MLSQNASSSVCSWYQVDMIRGLLVCAGRCERVRCFGIKREVMGSFLFIGGFNSRCSPLEGGDCAVCDVFGGQVTGSLLFTGYFNGCCSPLEEGECAICDGFGGRTEAADFRGVTGAGGAESAEVGGGPDDWGAAAEIEGRLYATVLTVTKLLLEPGGPGADLIRLDEL